jgi:sugar phosphate isomerase/epimerase
VPRTLAINDRVLCSGTIRSAPFETTVRAAAASGFQGISLYFDEYLSARNRGWSDDDMRALLDEHDLGVAEFDGRSSWLPGDDDAPPVADFIAAAAALDARSITVLELAGRRIGTDLPWVTVVDAFASVCDRAEPHGLLVHIEYYPSSGFVDFATAYEVVRRAERANGGVMVDTWHHLRGPDAGRLELGAPGSSVLALQISDIAPEASADLADEMLHHRVLPGRGAGNLSTLIRALREQGCTAPIEVEVYSDELTALDPFAAARCASDAIALVLCDAETR